MGQTKLYDWKSIFDFGKHKGESIKVIFEKSSSYISWCFQKIDWFCITDEIFEKLPIVIALRKDNRIGNVKKQKDFLKILMDKHYLKKQELTPESQFSVDDYNDDAENYEKKSYGQYSGTYAQDVEGLSDEFINDVLDGNPDAYWNID